MCWRVFVCYAFCFFGVVISVYRDPENARYADMFAVCISSIESRRFCSIRSLLDVWLTDGRVEGLRKLGSEPPLTQEGSGRRPVCIPVRKQQDS